MYSWADVAERTEKAYERALKAPPPSLVRRFQVPDLANYSRRTAC